MTLSIFSFCLLVISFSEKSIWIFCPFFLNVLSSYWIESIILNMMDTSSVIDICITNTYRHERIPPTERAVMIIPFSHIVPGCLQELNWFKCHLFVLCVWSELYWNWPQPLRTLGSTWNVCSAPVPPATATHFLVLIERILWTYRVYLLSDFLTSPPPSLFLMPQGMYLLLKIKRGLTVILFWKTFFLKEFHNPLWNI